MKRKCLKKSLEYFFGEKQQDFVKKYGGYWRQEITKYFFKRKILVFFHEKDIGGDGIGIFWRKNKSTTHAVVMRDGKVVFNPKNLLLEELRFFITFQKEFPPSRIEIKSF
jgi:hypothetical protein